MRTEAVARRWLAALVMIFTTLASALGTGSASASWHQHHWHVRTADVTFTKWLVELPARPSTMAGIHMKGIVGGDVGTGLYRDRVISDDPVTQPGVWHVRARYDFLGRDHRLIADMQITEDDRGALATTTIKGFVTAGWMAGASVTGQYTQHDICPIATPGNVFGTTCFVGKLHLRGGSWS
jgi:hypothetical protein